MCLELLIFPNPALHTNPDPDQKPYPESTSIILHTIKTQVQLRICFIFIYLCIFARSLCTATNQWSSNNGIWINKIRLILKTIRKYVIYKVSYKLWLSKGMANCACFRGTNYEEAQNLGSSDIFSLEISMILFIYLNIITVTI